MAGKSRRWRPTDSAHGATETFEGDYFFSTAPVRELMRAFDVAPPQNVLEVSDGLVYRDFITVGLLVRSLRIHDDTPQGKKLISDNWIYIQEPDVQLGRLQIFNNWSPFMVADPATVWLGLEYFCNQSDEIWNLSDERMVALASRELSKIGIIDAAEVLDSTVLRMEKDLSRVFRHLRPVRRDPRARGPVRQPVPDRPQRHASLQQPGPLHADRHDGGGRHHRG
jgi:protoporphyrinogen oxidase